MDFNPFTAVGDYPKMLNKVAMSTFFGGVLATWLLRPELSGLDLLKPLSMSTSVGSGFSLPIGTFLPAFVVAALFTVKEAWTKGNPPMF